MPLNAIIGILTPVAETFLAPLIEDAIAGASCVIRTEIAIATGYLRNLVAGTLDTFIQAEPHSSTGLSAQGLTRVVEDVVRATSYLAMITSEEIAEEMFMELIQEGFSNAIQTSVGGAFQSILNVWRGSIPLNPDEMSEVVRVIDAVDTDSASLLIAMSGNNLPTTFLRAIIGWRSYVDEQTRSIRTQLMELLRKWNETIAWIHELSKAIAETEFTNSLNVYREALTKAITIIDMVAERALSRLQELLIECRTAKEWLNMGAITETEAKMTALENEAEADVTYNTYETIKNSALSAVDKVTVDLYSLVDNINDMLVRYLQHINNMINACQLDFTQDFNKLKEALKKVSAYRHAVDTKTKIVFPIEIAGSPITPVIPGATYPVVVEYELTIYTY